MEQSQRGQMLTQKLVTFAKDQDPKKQWLNVNRKIDQVLNLLKTELTEIELKKDYAADLPELMADPGMIEQTLINILQNAIHALGFEPAPRLVVKTELNPEQLCIKISDNGCGIPQKHHGDIYTPSFTLKGSRDVLGAYKPIIKGTGYGMASVKKCIDKHDGQISFTSSPGTGTSFNLSFPSQDT